MATTPNAFHQKVAEYVELTTAERDAANAELAQRETQDQAVRQKAASVADALVQQGVVEQTHRDRLAQRLSDPLYTLDQLQKMAAQTRQTPAEPAAPRLGTTTGAQTTKLANRKPAKSQADLDFVAKLGLGPEYA